MTPDYGYHDMSYQPGIVRQTVTVLSSQVLFLQATMRYTTMTPWWARACHTPAFIGGNKAQSCCG